MIKENNNADQNTADPPSLPAPRPPLVEQLQSQSLLLEKKLLFLGDKELPGKSFLMKYHLFWPHVPAVLVPAWRFGFKSQYFVSVPIIAILIKILKTMLTHLSPTEMRKPTSRPFSHTPFIFSSPLTITPWQPQSEVNMTKSLKNGRKGYKEPHKPTFHLRRTQ